MNELNWRRPAGGDGEKAQRIASISHQSVPARRLVVGSLHSFSMHRISDDDDVVVVVGGVPVQFRTGINVVMAVLVGVGRRTVGLLFQKYDGI